MHAYRYCIQDLGDFTTSLFRFCSPHANSEFMNIVYNLLRGFDALVNKKNTKLRRVGNKLSTVVSRAWALDILLVYFVYNSSVLFHFK